MNEYEHDKLLEYLELCRLEYERMRRENSWPWKHDDSPDGSDVVESEDSSTDL